MEYVKKNYNTEVRIRSPIYMQLEAQFTDNRKNEEEAILEEFMVRNFQN